MKRKKKRKKVHPAGEEYFEFPVGCGMVKLKATGDVLTPYGGLVPWSAFLEKTGIVKTLVETCPVRRVSPNAARVFDVVQTFLFAAVCDGKRFVHINRLREDEAAREVLGMARVCGDDTVRRFFGSIGEKEGAQWIAWVMRRIWRALPGEGLVIDWDSTVQTKYGHQEGAAVGYNPQKRGRKSFHPLLGVAAGTRLCTYYRFRRGDTVTASEWDEAASESQRWLEGKAKVWLNRGDKALASEAVMAWHEVDEDRPHYLFKLTDLPPEEASPWQVADLYRKRADAENVLDELKNQWGFNGFTSGCRAVSAMAARLLLVAYNLWNLFMRLMCPARHLEAAGGRRWFLLIAARLTKSARQWTLQMSTKGNWWRLLQAGYRRLCAWLKATAPQLDFGANKIDLSPLISCQIPAPNCAF